MKNTWLLFVASLVISVIGLVLFFFFDFPFLLFFLFFPFVFGIRGTKGGREDYPRNYCRICGLTLSPDSFYCPSCGTLVN